MFRAIKRKIRTGYNIVRISMLSHDEKENNYQHQDEDWDKVGKAVVYTSITGGYDDLLSAPKIEDVDFVAYVDGAKGEKMRNGWKIREMPEDETLGNNILRNRYMKFHPFELFGGKYDYSIYIDGNIEVLGDIRKMLPGIDKKTGLAFHRHQRRDSVYKEIKACKILKKGNARKLNEQGARYKKEGFPREFGLYECNVIATDLHSKSAEKILNAWWEEFLKSESMRDQIALPYVVWKLGYEFNDVGSLGDNVYKNPLVRVTLHKEKR